MRYFMKPLLFLSIIILITSCDSTKKLYSDVNVKGCKGVRLINYDSYVKKDSTGTVLKKNLSTLDNILNKTLDLDLKQVSSDQYVELRKKSTTEATLNTPNNLVTAYNAKMNLLCAKQEELRRIVKDDSYPEQFRNTAGEKYYEILEDYKNFTNLISADLKKK
nr:hypothetical protein [Allomuricauda sp.]